VAALASGLARWEPSLTEKILVVDDEPDVGGTIVQAPRASGYEADMRNDSVAALELISRGSYDLIISDVVMPGLNGIQLLTLVKAQDHAPEVILVTGNASRKIAETALEHGAFAYVEKPFDVDELLDRTKQALWRHHLAAVQEQRARQQPLRSEPEGSPGS
jgi:DNA-binding response OmpR family regulator